MFVMRLGTYFVVRRFKIFKKLAYVKNSYVSEYVALSLCTLRHKKQSVCKQRFIIRKKMLHISAV